MTAWLGGGLGGLRSTVELKGVLSVGGRVEATESTGSLYSTDVLLRGSACQGPKGQSQPKLRYEIP